MNPRRGMPEFFLRVAAIAALCAVRVYAAQAPDAGAKAATVTEPAGTGAVAKASEGPGGDAATQTPKPEKVPSFRNPFWPVGWVYGPKTSTVAVVATSVVARVPERDPEDWAGAEKQLKLSVTGTGSGPKGAIFAFVTGRAVTVGDIMNLDLGKYKYSWKVRAISRKDGLQADRVGARYMGQ